MAKIAFTKQDWRRVLVAAALVGLLGLLATLQYRWIAGVSDAEREHMRAEVQAHAAQMAEEFDGVIARAYMSFLQPAASVGPDVAKTVTDRYARWVAFDPQHTKLLRGLFLVQFATKPPQVLRIRPGQPAEPTSWPAEFGAWAQRMEGATNTQTAPALRSLVIGEIPAFVAPLMNLTPATTSPMNMSFAFAGFAVGWLDRTYLEREYLPALARKHFSPSGSFDYDVAVVDRANRMLFASRAGLTRASFAQPDAQTGVLQVRLDQITRLAGSSTSAGLGRADPNAGEWKLLLVHRKGSIDKALAPMRIGNLIISFGAIFVVAVGVVFMLISTRRAQQLAQQQMEFVAGVSHELRTPLSVIRSAGENLSDGVVAEPEQVRRYGALIAEQGRRLSEMVEQVMAFAGFNSGRDISERTEVELAAVIEKAVAASRELIGENGFQVEQRIPEGLPRVCVNAPALSRAIENLLNNAVKYGGAGKWARVSAEIAPPGDEVRITVEDRGIGIGSDEQQRIFEPFYRGRTVMGSRIRGSGLGLSLVRRIMEAHGGSVSVRSAPGQGTAFTLHLPCTRATERV